MNIMKLIRNAVIRDARKFYHNRSARYENFEKATKEIYSESANKYDPHRRNLHLKIIKELMKGTKSYKEAQKPVVFLIGGGTATGKTTLRETIVMEKTKQYKCNFQTVDLDIIKNFIPEYEQLNRSCPKKAASFVHKESCDIRNMLVESLIMKQASFIYEGTLSNPKKYKHLVRRLRQEGYEIHLYVLDTPLSLAIQRAEKRAKLTGRTIPHHVIENTHQLVPKTFLAIKDSTDSYHIFESRDRFTLIISKILNDKNMYESFLKKAHGHK